MNFEKLYSVPEAAKLLGGLSPWTLYTWLGQGRLQRTKVGSRTMIKESELARLVEEGDKAPLPRQKKSKDRSDK